MKVICDASDLTALFTAKTPAEAPNTFVVAGYSISSEQLPQLITGAAAIKEKVLGRATVPVKWNVKGRGLERALALDNSADLSSKIRENSDTIRNELLQLLCSSGATFFLSAILAYSDDKQVLGKTKEDLVQYSFGNFLMRVGLFCQEQPLSEVQLILDWPEGNQRAPFVREFYSGWKDGKSAIETESVNYVCGPLGSLGFTAGLLFGVTDVDVRLQLADLVVGACSSFINYCMKRASEDAFGVQQFKTIAPHLYRNSNGHALGRGVSVSPTHSDFSKTILDGLNKLGV
jgi:hypothetical protein